LIIVDASVLANALTDDGQYGKVARQQLTISAATTPLTSLWLKRVRW
jgi:hypothetical protein